MTAPTIASRCRACSADIAPGAARCGRCGAMQSDTHTCPLCGAVADASPDDELRFRCDVCGAPRVPLLDASIRRSGKEVPPLKRAEAARRARAWGRTGAIIGGIGFGAVFLFFTAIAWIVSSGTVGVLGLLFSLPFVGLLAWSVARAKARGKEIQPALDAAWLAVATDVAEQSTGALTARDLAATMRIDEAQAEELLALLSVNDVLRSDVTDAGEIAYSRLRVAPIPGQAPGGGALDPASAEAEAEAEAEALAPKRTATADPRLK